MIINEEFQNIVIKKYTELKTLNETQGFLDQEIFGEIKVFLNEKPRYSICSFSIGEDILYVGSQVL
jgi:hypothetical protein